LRRFSLLLLSLAFILLIYCGWRALLTVRLISSSQDLSSQDLTEIIFPAKGPPGKADRVLKQLDNLLRKDREPRAPWKLSDRLAKHLPPSAEAAREQVESRQEIHRLLVKELPTSLEPPGEAPVLQDTHNFRLQRDLQRLLAEDCLSLILLGKKEAAWELLTAKERAGRLVARGIENNSSLIGKMLGVAFDIYGNRLGRVALTQELLSSEDKIELARILQIGLDREVPLDISVHAEFAMCRRAIEAVDARLGLLRYPLWFYWGNGLQQVDSLRKRWDAGWKNPPSEQELADYHIMLQMALPNLAKAKQRVQATREERKELVHDLLGG
jgi:hypothetical protein